jgi:hypothetical protein
MQRFSSLLSPLEVFQSIIGAKEETGLRMFKRCREEVALLPSLKRLLVLLSTSLSISILMTPSNSNMPGLQEPGRSCASLSLSNEWRDIGLATSLFISN